MSILIHSCQDVSTVFLLAHRQGCSLVCVCVREVSLSEVLSRPGEHFSLEAILLHNLLCYVKGQASLAYVLQGIGWSWGTRGASRPTDAGSEPCPSHLVETPSFFFFPSGPDVTALSLTLLLLLCPFSVFTVIFVIKTSLSP